jgi:predicted transcriptional regulator
MIPDTQGQAVKAPAAKYRSQLRIYVDMMYVIQRENNEAKPTRILYGANLSHDRLVKYLEELESLGVIQETGIDDKVYSLTQKGIEFLNNFRRVESFASAFGFKI